ncbi:TolC family protein, partial [Pseudomonadales bacterium]|nr:TolC family protein [Pseudomonadales bacterium]
MQQEILPIRLKRLYLQISRQMALTLLLPTALLMSASTQAASLDEIYTLAVINDPQLGAAKAGFLARSEVVNQARAGLLPSISLNASTSQNERTILRPSLPTENYNDNGWQAVLRQPVFRLSNWFQFQQSKNIKAQAQAQFTAEQQELIYRVADNYLNILEAQDRWSAANAQRDAVQRQLEQVQQRFDVGLVAITDV